MPAGRPSDYDQPIADAICERLGSGESLRAICEDEGMPDKATVFRWLGKHAEFRDQYARARELQSEHWAEEILEISDDGRNDTVKDEDGHESVNHDVIARSRLRVDTRKWLMSKLTPKKYGDKVTHAGDPEQPIKVLTRIENVIVDPSSRSSEGVPAPSQAKPV